MKLQDIKASQLEINGLIFDIDRTENASPIRITVKTVTGETKMVVNVSNYSIQLLEPAQPKMKKVHRLTGWVIGQKVVADYEYEHEARNAAKNLPLDPPQSIEVVEVEDV